ncbi:nitronate monooxygenase family protein [Novosphingobium sp. Fuku2-ISO-50]|uniref:NAD(P)H-dependent flavin oxidoreductase n=1 Tax=Novosphingobium sp. Fuku2-ISO-50 TaxID=1739114 RepID=UPI00076C283B|nr:nitronate monooxygenase [Novosphingobium sp. Fuku2-ISO-50]KUR77576.1 2-nitropropane dioxygenase [Novosphingobium sp. Fuku2-ISO-50]
MTALLDRLGIALPILQAPMAGVSSPAMAAAVSEAGGLGALGLGAAGVAGAQEMIAHLRKRSDRPFGVNVFVHTPARRDAAREAGWIERWRPEFARFKAEPPARLDEIYTSFAVDDAMLAMLLAERPAVVSFHFGLPDAARIAALRDAGITLLATATNLAEARAAKAAGIDAIIAQGWEAGGHRGSFDPDAPDDRLGTLALVRILARQADIPVIAAGGIMDGAAIDAALALGAAAAQLGTAYVATDESLADPGYRAALAGPAAHHTTMTRVISGRPARCLANRFTAIGADIPAEAIPAYPVAYDLGKALNAAAKAKAEPGFGAQWAGQGAPLARAMPAAALTRMLAGEMRPRPIG